MQTYIDVLNQGDKKRYYVENIYSTLNIEWKIGELEESSIKALSKKNLLKYEGLKIKLKAKVKDVADKIFGNIGFSMGTHYDRDDHFGFKPSFEDLVMDIQNGNYKENLQKKERYYLNKDKMKIEIVTIVDKFDGVCKLKNKEGLFSKSLLFKSLISLHIDICKTYLFHSTAFFKREQIDFFLKNIFTPVNIINHTEEIYELFSGAYSFGYIDYNRDMNKDKSLKQFGLYEYAILTYDVICRYCNLNVDGEKYANPYFSSFGSYLKNKHTDMFIPCGFNYDKIKCKTNVDIIKWYEENNVNIKNESPLY